MFAEKNRKKLEGMMYSTDETRVETRNNRSSCYLTLSKGMGRPRTIKGISARIHLTITRWYIPPSPLPFCLGLYPDLWPLFPYCLNVKVQKGLVFSPGCISLLKFRFISKVCLLVNTSNLICLKRSSCCSLLKPSLLSSSVPF